MAIIYFPDIDFLDIESKLFGSSGVSVSFLLLNTLNHSLGVGVIWKGVADQFM